MCRAVGNNESVVIHTLSDMYAAEARNYLIAHQVEAACC
jgi:hypothetical protein